MKKILLVVLIGFLGLFICCFPSPTKVRNVEGTILATYKAEFNDFNGNFIIWQKERWATGLFEDSSPCQIWFLYSLQEFPKAPFKLQLTYRWTQQVSGIPIVRVINLKVLKENH